MKKRRGGSMRDQMKFLETNNRRINSNSDSSAGLCETQLFEGDGLKILPESKEFRFRCCNCALIHRIEIEHDDEGVILRFFEEA